MQTATDTPFTPGQEDALVDSLLRPDLPARGGRARLRLEPPRPVDAVLAAWSAVVAANPYLATTLTRADDAVLPRLAPLDRAPEVLVGPVPADVGVRLVEQQPLHRLTAVPTDGSDGSDGSAASPVAELVLDHHQLLLDERSAALVLAECATALASGQPRTFAAGADYVDWYAGQDIPRIEAFWAQRLALLDGATWLLDESRAEPAVTDRVDLTLPADVAEGCAVVAERLGVPPSWVVLLAWGVTVCRFRGGEDSAVGVLADVRPANLRDALGNFETVLPYVVEFDRSPLPLWLAQQAAAVRDLVRCGHLATARRNDLSGVERGTALFDSVVDVRPAPVGAASTESLDADAAVPLRLSYADRVLSLVFDPERVDAAAVQHYLRSVTAVLSAFGALSTSAPLPTDVAAVSLLDDPMRADVVAHNATAAPYPDRRCLHELVEDQVDLRPDEVALVFEDTTLSYRELDERANRLAHELIERGVGPDGVVGLCSEPSLELCVGILAIHKAGAAYAPLDPYFPEERLAYLYGDLSCSVVLCQARHLDRLPAGPGAGSGRLLLLDDPTVWAHQPETRPEVAVGPDNLAYVMYTSGSTGRPKGVLIEHGGAVNFLWWMRDRFDLQAGEAALQWTAYSFDAAVWELFWPLVVGGRAVVAPGKIHLDLARFIDLVVDQQIVTLHFVPAMLQTFLSAPDVRRCTSLRHVFVSGEPVPVSLMDRFHDLLPGDLINLYGVTEVSIDSTYYVCERGSESAFVRSGVPLSNTATYVLDESLQPLPFGARGEVFIAGDSVTRGYLNRRGLTADRFVPDPFGSPGARMYRTGDVAQLLPDGHLRFLGRSDHQVKIRGIRVELLEVAAELNACPGVQESLVVAFGEGSERGLAAYVVRAPGQQVDATEIRRFMGGRVPPYMVPNAVVLLAEFPLNNNGKIDRKALPAPNDGAREESSGRPPETVVECEIARIWSRLLEVPAIGADQEFFGVGGNSLLATQVIAEVRRTFAVDLPLQEWLEASTVAQLAAAVERQRERSGEADLDAGAALRVLDEVELGVPAR